MLILWPSNLLSSPHNIAVVHVFGGLMDKGAKRVELIVDEVGPLDGDPHTAFERSHYKFTDVHGDSMDEGK